MTVRSCGFVAVAAAALAIACEGKSSTPVAPSTLQDQAGAAIPGTLAPMSASAAQHAVTMFDACDPETFNAVIGPGTCTRSGGVRFEDFVAQLTRHHSIGAWHFAPSQVTMRVGQELVANNRGGEAHTFTEVEHFGGGIIPALNAASGNPVEAEECKSVTPANDFIAPGQSRVDVADEEGAELYQCCIHPWMRAEVRISEK